MNVFHDLVDGLNDLSQISNISDVICFVVDEYDSYYIWRKDMCLLCDGLVISLKDDGGWMIVRFDYTADQEAFLKSRSAEISKFSYAADCKPCSFSNILFGDHSVLKVQEIEQYFYNGDGPRLPGRDVRDLQLFALRLRLEGGWILVEAPRLGGMVVTGGLGDGEGDPTLLYPGQVTVTQTKVPGS